MLTKRSHSLYRGRDWRVNSDWLGTCFYQRLVPRATGAPGRDACPGCNQGRLPGEKSA